MDKFSKTLSHTKLKILQKYGGAEHTVDEEFVAMRLRLENLYRFHQNYTTQMKKYEDIVAQLGSPVLEMSSAFTSYYEEEAKYEEDAKQDHLIDGNKCRVIASNISKAATQFTEQQKTLLVEMHAYENSISKMRAHTKTRESLLLDYDNYKNQYSAYKEKDKTKEKNYEQKLSQHEEKYVNAKQKYENFHDQLKRELRELLEKRYETIDSYFQKFALYQIDMFTEAGQAFLVLDNNILEKVTKMNDEKRKQNYLNLTENLPKTTPVTKSDEPKKPAEPAVETKRVDDTPKKVEPAKEPVIEIKRTDDAPKKTDPTLEIKRVDDTPKKVEQPKEEKPKKTEPVIEIKRTDDTPKKTEPVIEIKRVDDTPKKVEPVKEENSKEAPKEELKKVEEEEAEEGEQMKALFDYSAAETNELSFKEGDIVTIINRVEGSEWCKATLNGKSGLVPVTFFEPIKAKEETVVAILDYEASDPDEISFKTGDVIVVMKRFEDNKDWAIGQVHGKVGMFPVSYVKESAPVKLVVKVRAIITYDAQDEDEIGFKEGDIIIVTQEIEGSDWNKGRVEGSDKVGLFPATYTEPLK